MRPILTILVFFLASSLCFGQFSATRTDPTTGFYMTKVVSDTAINIGQPFSYTVFFNIPVGTTSLTLTDAVPAPLAILNTSFSLPSNTGCTYSPTAPLSVSGNTVTMSLTNIPACFSGVGSFEITVQFPNGTTCNGTTVRNRVCASGKINGIDIQSSGSQPFCLGEGVKTIAIANKPWKVKKLPLLPSYNSSAGCWQTSDSVVKWGIRVYRDNPSPIGNLDVLGATVTDVLPPGATFVGSTCSTAVSYNSTTNTITWNVGALSASANPPYIDCYFTVSYPRVSFPFGATISNFALLNGTLGSSASPCGRFTVSSDTTCVNIVSSTPTSGYVQKNFYSATNQAGCFAQYELFFCNRGVTDIPSFNGQDILPSSIASTAYFEGTTATTVNTGGMIATLSGGIVTVTSTTPLLVGECRSITINFTIPQVPAGTVISNTMSMTYGTPPQTAQTTTTFAVRENKPVPCLYKEIVCKNPNQVDYQLGSTIRYRLRLQNIGGGSLTGVIQDVLNPNLEYIGNPTSYWGTTPIQPCGGGTQTLPWSGVSVIPPPSGSNTVTINYPPITSQVCDVKASPSCGENVDNGLNYYFIEFDVKVRESSALGNIPNRFSVSGGTIGNEVFSNTVLALVDGNPTMSISKGVRSTPTQPYSTTTSAASGSTLRYRLQATIPTGAPYLNEIHFVDLLPKNDGSNSDKFITSPCGNRASQFDVTLANGTIQSQTGSIFYTHPNTGGASGNQPSYLTFVGNGAMPLLFNQPTCGVNGGWISLMSPPQTGTKNLGIYLGTVIPGTGIKTVEFDANVSNTAINGQQACNTFIAGGWVQWLINSSLVSYQRVISPESNTACITILDTIRCMGANLDSVRVGGWVNNRCTNNIFTTLTNPNTTTATYTITSSSGVTVSPTTITLAGGASVQQLFTVSPTTPSQNICLYFTNSIGSQQRPCDSICFTALACPPLPSCFSPVNFTGCYNNAQQLYNVTMTGSNTNGAVTVVLTSPSGIVPASFALSGNGTFTRTFTVPAPAPGVISLNYTIMTATGQSIACSTKFDLAICPVPPPPTCCQNFVKDFRNIRIFSNPSNPPTSPPAISLGGVRLNADVVAGSANTPIRKFTATIVSAQFRNRNIGGFGPWTRTSGDMFALTTNTTGFVGPFLSPPLVKSSQIPTPSTTSASTGPLPIAPPFSREAVWNGAQSQPCQDWFRGNAGVNLTLDMIFPPPMISNHPLRFQQLSFSVKFTFTDCNCITCDTTLHFVIRWAQSPIISGGGGPFPTAIQQLQSGKEGNQLQSEVPARTSIIMESATKGKLWIINPQSPDNSITVKGVEMVSQLSEFVSLRNGAIPGIVNGTTGFIPADVKPGTNGEIDIVMKPISGLSVYNYDVRFLYIDSTSDEIQYTDVYKMTARVPGSTSDIMDIDKATKPANVRTYALYFKNVNGYKENVSRIRIKTTDNARILAVGPQSESGTELTLIPVYKQSGSIVLPQSTDLGSGVAPDSIVKPIYLTLSGVSGTTKVNYEALDDNNTVISNGSFLLSDPISQVDDTGGEEAIKGEKAPGVSILPSPNPTTNVTTISVQLERPLQRVSIKLVDILGREVLRVISNTQLPIGNHVFATDVSSLPSGTYYIILSSEEGQVSEGLVITR